MLLRPFYKTLTVVAAIGSLWLNNARADAPAARADRQYQAQWIWGHVASREPFQFVRFRKTIDLASRPDRATAYITADTFYRLWINGQLVMHGPARSSRGKATVDPITVGRHLAQGRNTLMVEAFHGVCPFEALAQAPGLLCEFFNTVIPTQPLFWVLHAGLYERCSGDTELIRTVLPVIRRNLAAMDGWRNSDGLFESIPGWMFFDYAAMRTDGVSVALNAVYARTLDEAARLERLAGEAAGAGEYERRAQQVRGSLNRLCAGDTFYPDVLVRDPQRQLVPSREACETTQYFVLWGSVPSLDRQQRMWTALRDDFLPTPLKRVQPIRGLTRAGLYPFPQRLEVAARLGDHAALLRDTKAMFLPMVESPPGTLWEDPLAGIALCHSIAVSLTCFLTSVLSVQFVVRNSGYALDCDGVQNVPQFFAEIPKTGPSERPAHLAGGRQTCRVNSSMPSPDGNT
jgi:hypothetical protein